VNDAISKPPPVLDCARVLEYAVLSDSVSFSGRTLLFVDGKELDRAPCLAICQKLNEADVLLFHCDSEWEVLGAGGYPSVADAKGRAERIYPGVSGCWVQAHVSEADASNYLDEMWGDERCSFCGRRPDEVPQMFAKGKAYICAKCITKFHDRLRQGPPWPEDE
jgi:hypothetical protein